MTTSGTISAIMSCFNVEKTLHKAIDSIINQSYFDWVMICCDDGSTDNTFSILRAYKEQYPDKFIIIRNERNQKLPYSLNRCLRRVRTEYVARMDADDWSAPDRFEKQIQYLKDHPEVDLVGTGIGVSDGIKTLTTFVQKQDPEAGDMFNSNCFSHATIMTHSYVYHKLGGYSLDPRVERCEDLELWSRFFQEGFVGHNLPDILYYVLEDENAFKRRDLRARLNAFYTGRLVYRRLHITGARAHIRPWVELSKALVPYRLYNKLHIWTMGRTNQKLNRKQD